MLPTDHLLAPRNDLQETAINNANLIWFTDGSYLKDKQGHYRTGYAVTSTVNVTELSYLPQIRSALQAKLIALTPACQFAEDQIASNLH